MTRWMQAMRGVVACAILVMVASGLTDSTAATPTHARDFVAEITLDGAIGPATAEYFDDAAKRATSDGATAIILRMDTPGGLAESMRHIVSGILASEIPVLGYVAPGGARAASAGTYILYACQVAAMAPATHLGAATPVALGGNGTPLPSRARADSGRAGAPSDSADPAASDAPDRGSAESRKSLNDAIAYIRSLAQLRGRNAEWAEQAVRGAATLTASEAAEQHVIDFVANDAADVLRQANGRAVRLGERTATLDLANQEVRAYAPNWRTRFLATITNPTIAYVLLLAGIYGLILEAFHPGTLLPGIAGGICLLVGLYALQMLPVNYAGLALMALGIGLLIAEVLTPTVGAVGAGGVIAFVLGSILLFNTDVPGYVVNLGVIGGIALCAIMLLAAILWLAMRARRARQISGDQQMLDATGELLEASDASGEAWALVYGERWRVRASAPLAAGTRVRVIRREGLLLWVVSE